MLIIIQISMGNTLNLLSTCLPQQPVVSSPPLSSTSHVEDTPVAEGEEDEQEDDFFFAEERTKQSPQTSNSTVASSRFGHQSNNILYSGHNKIKWSKQLKFTTKSKH